MSLYNEYANKPWMRPTMYTSDADPSHHAGVSRQTELVNGVPVVVEGREHYQPTEFGDGRPDPRMVDQSPMVYRGPEPGGVIDIDDRDEIDEPPQEYVPTPRMQPQPQPRPRPAQAQPQAPNPAPAPAVGGWPKLELEILGLSPHGSVPEAMIGAGQAAFRASAEDLEHAATMLQACAKMLRAMRR